MSKTTTTANVINLDLGAKEFTLNGNPDAKIYLNPNDMGIVARIQEVVPKINELEMTYVSSYFDEDDDVDSTEIPEDKKVERVLSKLSETIKSIDTDMRECINYIFDYDVCSVAKPVGTMLDIYDGEYAFAIIINTLLELYSDTITKETDKLVTKMKKRAEKYTAQDHKRKSKK